MSGASGARRLVRRAGGFGQEAVEAVTAVALHLHIPVDLAVRRLAGRPRGDKSLLVEPATYLRESCRWQRIALDVLSCPVVCIDASQPPDRVWAQARIALDPLSLTRSRPVEEKGGADPSVENRTVPYILISG